MVISCPGPDVPALADEVNLNSAVVVVRAGERSAAETMAATILVEEIEKRTGIRLAVRDRWFDDAKAIIALTTRDAKTAWADRLPNREGKDLPEAKPEGFALHGKAGDGQHPTIISVIGADGRGVMYGAGQLLRLMTLADRTIKLESLPDFASSPEYPDSRSPIGLSGHGPTATMPGLRSSTNSTSASWWCSGRTASRTSPSRTHRRASTCGFRGRK